MALVLQQQHLAIRSLQHSYYPPRQFDLPTTAAMRLYVLVATVIGATLVATGNALDTSKVTALRGATTTADIATGGDALAERLLATNELTNEDEEERGRKRRRRRRRRRSSDDEEEDSSDDSNDNRRRRRRRFSLFD
ncbi:hypothetical protein F442_03974 [Phytophthora nicotianae P10297]|uniref:Uncharacterized protein n=2 Tax=Phytophthora nicotianae TaxID=4792 RepID=W2QLH5_PHYN3|nr:hypothetical protein PPTG_08039 [Phytophthora nicotianae INRA-310]ETN13110.1 hypothetical protein PPTG_08039 [Phytophthora nicotianae INRA-310]ETP50810.1 hypothetical protein F442_03974 [Phytophthora nicotianae P10297]